MYIILGFNDIGKLLVESLNQSGEKVFIISNEPTLMELEKPNLCTVLKDINILHSPSFQANEIIAFIILHKNFEDNLSAIRNTKKLFPAKFILSITPNDKEASELIENGADYVIQTTSLVKSAIQNKLETARLKKSVSNLVNIIKSAINNGIAIFLQDNPDPDAIASGLALKRIAEEYNVKSKIYYGGNITYNQNRMLINLLKTELIQLKRPDDVLGILSTADKIALIEASIPSKNNILPPNIILNIIIDHHQTDLRLVKGEFVEISPKIGATSTIMTRYLRYLGIVPNPSLATALRYGIRIDTGGFTRNTTTEDIDAAAYLSPLVNLALLNQIEAIHMNSETIDIIGRAIRNKKISGSYLTSFVEYITDRDALPQAAELLLQMEGISTVLIYGVNKDKIQLSARSTNPTLNLALLLQKAFGFMNAGGHPTMAAGSIELNDLNITDKKSLFKTITDTVEQKLFAAIGIDFIKDEIHKELELVGN
jgi:nanoRNase/pAp phosphatase (c-di-AMP/oligoRNAs hydrolase)